MKILYSETIMLYIVAICIGMMLLAILMYFAYLKYIIGYELNYNTNMINNKQFNINKKCAVLISGQFRNNIEMLYNMQYYNIIVPLNADVFIFADDNMNDSEKQKIISLYKPVVCKWSKHTIKKKPFFENNVELMYHKIYNCNLLKKQYEISQNFTYDIVIRLRPDAIINKIFPINIAKNIMPNTLYIPIHNDYNELTSGGHNNVSDQFAVGDSHTMDIYSIAFLYLEKYYMVYLKYSPYACPNSEHFLKIYLDKMKLKIHKFYYITLPYGNRLNYDNFFSAIKHLVYNKSNATYKCINQLVF